VHEKTVQIVRSGAQTRYSWKMASALWPVIGRKKEPVWERQGGKAREDNHGSQKRACWNEKEKRSGTGRLDRPPGEKKGSSRSLGNRTKRRHQRGEEGQTNNAKRLNRRNGFPITPRWEHTSFKGGGSEGKGKEEGGGGQVKWR